MAKPNMVQDNGIPKVSKYIAAQVAKHLPEDVDGDKVHAMMQAWTKVLSGDPVGTVKINDDGVLAHRVEINGVPQWRISHPDGGTMTDASQAHASLPWTQLFPRKDQG
jgi:hypothetical protein